MTRQPTTTNTVSDSPFMTRQPTTTNTVTTRFSFYDQTAHRQQTQLQPDSPFMIRQSTSGAEMKEAFARTLRHAVITPHLMSRDLGVLIRHLRPAIGRQAMQHYASTAPSTISPNTGSMSSISSLSVTLCLSVCLSLFLSSRARCLLQLTSTTLCLISPCCERT